jgi:hypothetical protein
MKLLWGRFVQEVAGRVVGVGCGAAKGTGLRGLEGRDTKAMLRRGKDETFKQLLAHLDMAIENTTTDNVYVDDVNTPQG